MYEVAPFRIIQILQTILLEDSWQGIERRPLSQYKQVTNMAQPRQSWLRWDDETLIHDEGIW